MGIKRYKNTGFQLFPGNTKTGGIMRLSILSDQQLAQAYNQAKKLNLDEAFIQMLKKEIESRNLFKETKPFDA